MLLAANTTWYVCIAVLKRDNKIVGLRLMQVPSFVDCGTYELEYLYVNRVPIFNVMVQERISKNGKSTLIAVGTHGDISRYPVMDNNGDAVFARTLTVVATVTYEEEKVFKIWLTGGKCKEEVRRVPVTYYIMSNYEGCVGKMSPEWALQLAIKYHVSNAAVLGTRLKPLKLKGITKSEFLELTDTDKHLVDQRKFITQMGHIDAVANNADALMGYMVRNELVALTPEQNRRCRVLGDTVNNGALGLTEKEIIDINRYFDRVIIWGYLPKSGLDFMMKMYDKVCSDDAKMSKMFGLDCDTDFNATGLQACFSTLKSPVDRVYNMEAYANMHGEAKATYCLVLRQEPQVTSLMQSVANQLGCKLEGLDYRIKSPSSFVEKVYEREKLEGATVKAACDNMSDILRYTMIFDCTDTNDHYTENTDALIKYLRGVIDHALLHFRNYWSVKSNPYNGINTAFKLPDTVIKYELQVHTPDSFKLKNGEMHSLYEEQRAVGTTDERRKELKKLMDTLSSRVRVPNGVIEFTVSLWDNFGKHIQTEGVHRDNASLLHHSLMDAMKGFKK